MRFSTFVLAIAATTATLVSAVDFSRIDPAVLRARAAKYRPKRPTLPRDEQSSPLKKRDSPYLNANTQKFLVDGTALPDVAFDIGESYAGLLPISNATNETREYFFWFFPSSNPAATNEITIWFTGGPGCSGLVALLQENGPFLWQPGTYAPTPNPYSWTNLTNMLYIEQPLGVGFDQGRPDIVDEVGLSREFLGFFQSFETAFNIKDRDVFVTGESYGGYYVPYVSDALLTAGYNLKGALIYDPTIGNDDLQFELPAVPFANYWQKILNFNKTYSDDINARAESCGYTAYLEKYFTFPPPSTFPPPPNSSADGCDLNDAVFEGALDQNPCWNYYHISEMCPYAYSVLGADAFGYEPPGAVTYFNRPEVQRVIHAPSKNWTLCVNGVFANNGTNRRGDLSLGPALNGVLQRVVESTNNTIIGQGNLDFVLMTNGTLFAIQNLTWNGLQGFQQYPNTDFYVPYHPEYNQGALTGAGIVGSYRTERGLTFSSVQLAGHELPEYHAGAAYRHMELLLKRIPDLSYTGPFTTQSNRTS